MTEADCHTRLKFVRAGIDTYQQPVVYMHKDCEICRSEGFVALTRLRMQEDDKELIVTLNVVMKDWIAVDEVDLSESTWNLIEPFAETHAIFHHAEPAQSSGSLRAKVFGVRLEVADFLALRQYPMQKGLVENITPRLNAGVGISFKMMNHSSRSMINLVTGMSPQWRV